MRGTISANNPWDVMVDLFFYREPEEVETVEDAPEAFQPAPEAAANFGMPPPEWDGTGAPATEWDPAQVLTTPTAPHRQWHHGSQLL